LNHPAVLHPFLCFLDETLKVFAGWFDSPTNRIIRRQLLYDCPKYADSEPFALFRLTEQNKVLSHVESRRQ
jgi:hypothetical protein